MRGIANEARDERIYRMFAIEGKTHASIAALLGIPETTIGMALVHYRKRKGLKPPGRGRPVRRIEDRWDEYAAVDDSGPKCRCGLRLPCNDCLPVSATAFAQQRRSHWSDLLEQPDYGLSNLVRNVWKKQQAK